MGEAVVGRGDCNVCLVDELTFAFTGDVPFAFIGDVPLDFVGEASFSADFGLGKGGRANEDEVMRDVAFSLALEAAVFGRTNGSSRRGGISCSKVSGIAIVNGVDRRSVVFVASKGTAAELTDWPASDARLESGLGSAEATGRDISAEIVGGDDS